MSAVKMRTERNCALASLVLSASITLSVFLSVFNARDQLAFEDIRQSVFLHEKLLNQSHQYLEQCKGVLASLRLEEANIRRAKSNIGK
jgi:hypothetical protein